MKTKLFGEEQDENIILSNLEASNCGVEELKDFVRPFTDEEQKEVEEAFLLKSKELNTLNKKLEAVSNPIKEAIKPIKKETARLIESIQKGGVTVTEKIYCFPDYESSLMGLYDSRGVLVGTRALSRSEKQYHINSGLKIANG